MKNYDVLIIGGGPAGRTIVHKLHKTSPQTRTAIIKNEEINVNRCAVPYGISDKKPEEKFCIPNSLVTDFGADLIVDTAQKLDPESSLVHTISGETFSYKHLVLALGARPFVPDITGVNLENITSVRSKNDMSHLRNFAKNFKKGVVIGGGFIGIEVAAEFAELGLDVTIIEMMPRLMANTLNNDFTEIIEKEMEKKDIKIIKNTSVKEFKGDKKISSVVLNDGMEIKADFAVLSTGVCPNIELAEKAGLKTDKFGIIVDDFLRTDFKNIYASGDCASKKSFITKKPVRGEFGTNAVFMSKVIADNILGKEKKFMGVINAGVSTAFDYSFGTAGFTEKMAQAEGLDYISGYSEVLDMYPMMDNVSKIMTRLVFDRKTKRLTGGSVLRKGRCTANNIDFISMAIQMKVTAYDLAEYQYATQPELAAKPSDNSYVFAAEDALKKI
jgi:NADH dehydrogenase